MLDEMNEAGRSQQSTTLVKKKNSSGSSTTKKKVADTVGGVRRFCDSSSRNLSRSSKEKKRRRAVESDSESSDYSSETTRQKAHKPSAVYEGVYLGTKEFETEKRASSGVDVFEFDEYDGFDYKHRWHSYRQSGDQMKSGNGSSRPTYVVRSQLEMEDDDFDLPLSVLSKKYRSSPNQPVKLQGKNGVTKVSVLHRSYDKKEAEDHQKESKPRVLHKKKLYKNGDHKDEQSSITEDTKSKEKSRLKSLKPLVAKSSKEITEIDTLMESKSNIRVEIVKKPEKVKKVKEESIEKKMLREKIKNMLVDAGWTIGYRPRKNKDYLDAIYTNPSGTVYWSIIKAYESLQKEDSKKFTPLPVEILGKLARQTQTKTERELKTNRKYGRITRNAKRAMEDTMSDHEDELNSHGRKTRRLRRCTLLVRYSNKVISLENDGFSPYSGKRTILAWLIDSGVVRMSEHVEYMNGRRTRGLLKGRITRDGIHCGCCSKILTVLKFEQHSGSKLCNPFANMFLESGKSLMQCQIDAWSKLGELEQRGFYTVDVDGDGGDDDDDDPNDDTCGICGDGGDLMCCDGCPSTFHQSCLDIKMIPEGDWLCPNCSCKYCEMAGGNRTKEGGKTEASLFTCCLCYKKYHESCRPGIDVKPHESNSLDLSFCGQKCHEVYTRLKKVVGVKHELDLGFSWSLIHRSDSLTDGERVECNSMLAVAMSVMDECFLPFTDSRSGTNLIRNVVFNCGSNLDRLNYSGFYTAILEKGDEVVSAASIRFHGTQLAEMPFIGTRHIYRRQGMCRRLLSAIESALSALQVDKLIIPAVAEHMYTWTDVFGFQPLEESHKQEVKSMNMLVFPGTDMLQKPPLKQAIPEGNNTVEVDGGSALSKKSELISFNVAESSDKNASLDASKEKETLLIEPPVKDESPCEPKLQLTGTEVDSIHSHSDSEVNGIDVQNGNVTNPLPAQVHDPSHGGIPSAITCKSNTHIHASPSSELKLQHSGKESDSIHSHSDSKANGIAMQNGAETNSKEGSCGGERNRKEKERGIPVAVSDSEATNNLSGLHSCNNASEVDDHSSLSKNMELISSNVVDLSDKTAIMDSGSQELGVPLDDGCSLDVQTVGNNTVELDDHTTVSKTSELISPVKDDQLSGKESVSIHLHSYSKVDEIAVQNSNGTDTKGNNTVEEDEGSALSKKPDSDVAEFSDKTTNTDSASQEFVVPLDNIDTPVKDETPCEPEVQLQGMESDSIHLHSDSKVDEVDVQNGHGTNSLLEQVHDGNLSSFSCESHEQVPAPNEPKLQQPGKESDSINSHSNSKLDEIYMQNGNGTDPSHDDTSSDIPCDTHEQVPTAPIKSKLQQPGDESDSIHSHSDSKVNKIPMQNSNGNPEKEAVKDDIQFFEAKEGSCESEMKIKEMERGIIGAVSDDVSSNARKT